jgi:hypothetical protein
MASEIFVMPYNIFIILVQVSFIHNFYIRVQMGKLTY